MRGEGETQEEGLGLSKPSSYGSPLNYKPALVIYPTRIKSWATAAADLQHPMKGAQSGEQK